MYLLLDVIPMILKSAAAELLLNALKEAIR